MSVVISNGNTTISTPNGFYRCESSNLNFTGAGQVTVSTVANHLSVTFANSGNLLGVGLGLISINSSLLIPNNRGMRINLAENNGIFTVNIAAPGVFTQVGHGLNDLDEIFFDTTGALPTGILKKTGRYYVRNKTADTFNISTTPTGSLVTTSGTQSGVHTLWVARISQSYTDAEIMAPSVNTWERHYTGLIVPFEFTAPYAVDTTANKWRFVFWQEGGTTGAYYFTVSNGVISEYFNHFAWCDNQVSFTNDDVLICKDVVTIDTDFKVRGVLGIGNTVYGNACIICRSLDKTEPGIYKLVWDSTPAASYTMTVDGIVLLSDHGGFKIGDENNVIPASAKAIVSFVNPVTVGTEVSSIRPHFYSTASRPIGKNGMSFYGEIPTKRYGELASEALTGQNKIVLTEDMSTDWQVGDVLGIGKVDYNGQGSVVTSVIFSFNGTEITLAGNIPSYKRYIGATVLNLSRNYGVKFTSSITSPTVANYIYTASSIHNKFSGCDFYNVYQTGAYYGTTMMYEDGDITKGYHCDCFGQTNLNIGAAMFASPIINSLGDDVKRNLLWRYNIVGPLGAYYGLTRKSGVLNVEENRILQNYSYNAGTASSTNYKSQWINNRWENSYYGALYIYGLKPIVTGNLFWGGSSTQPAVQFGTFSSGARFSNNTFDHNYFAYGYGTGGIMIDGQSKNDIFGQEDANNIDFYTPVGTYGDFSIISPTGSIIVDAQYITETLNGFKFRLSDDNNTANVDKMYLTEGYYVRCGDGLADTTVHTAGAGKFSLRLEPLNEALKFEQFIPTGDISGKTMSVLAWVKLNSANYWGGTYTMPKLIVDYDDGTVVEAVALQTTDWQLLSLPFTPTTATGRIKVTLQVESSATGTDAQVYFDDMSVLYPAGHKLDLGGMDLWNGAEPITPSIATTVSAADIWNFPIANLNASGTTGKKLKDGLTMGKFLGLK